MSHFSVAVFTKEGGASVKQLLEKYWENLETPKYIKYTKEQLIEKVKKEIKEFAQTTYAEFLKDKEAYMEKKMKDHHDPHNDPHIKYLENEFPKKLKWSDEEIYQNQLEYYDEEDISSDGGIYSTHNPHAKWDWYQIGGRWRNYLNAKYAADTDSAKVKNVNFSNNNFNTFAVVTPDGEWHECGEMFWFGIHSASSEEIEEWEKNYKKRFIDTADPEWTITIVDCHI